MTLYQDFRPVATHACARRPGERRTVADHLPPSAQRFFEAACERALAHDSPHYRTFKTILAGGHDL